jgi:hypothetical protein
MSLKRASGIASPPLQNREGAGPAQILRGTKAEIVLRHLALARLAAELRRAASAIWIFSSAECRLRVARRMSWTTFSAVAFCVTGFWLIATPWW